MYKYIFGERKPLAKKPKLWRINLLLELSCSAWQKIAAIVKVKFGHVCKDAKYITLKDLLDNIILLVLDIYALFYILAILTLTLNHVFKFGLFFLNLIVKTILKHF